MDETKIELMLKFNVNEVNLILKTLAKQPFEEVASLIQRIKADGESQIAAMNQQQESQPPAADGGAGLTD